MKFRSFLEYAFGISFIIRFRFFFVFQCVSFVVARLALGTKKNRASHVFTIHNSMCSVFDERVWVQKTDGMQAGERVNKLERMLRKAPNTEKKTKHEATHRGDGNEHKYEWGFVPNRHEL